MKIYRLILGAGNAHAQTCLQGGYIGMDYDIAQDLTGRLPDDWRTFNREFIPIYLAAHPDKSRIAAGLACGMLWTVAKGMERGDMVLCPDGTGAYHVGEIVDDYVYAPAAVLPHQRPVRWTGATISRAAMSEALQASVGARGTVCDLTRHQAEIQGLLRAAAGPAIIARDPEVEDPAAFAMEKHLEDFLVHNWAQTELGRDYEIYTEDGEVVGQQYQTDTGPMDILAISRDRRELLVVELKRGRAADVVVGQVLRYMGYTMAELAEEGQTVSGAIIALGDDVRLRHALRAAQNIRFYRYQVDFRLIAG